MSFPFFRHLLLIIGGILPFCLACAKPPTTVSFPPPHKASREQIIEAIKNEAFDFASLKSLVKVAIAYPDGEKKKKQSFDGALLYRKSGEFRLQGFGILGRTLFDLVYKPNELVLYIPSSSSAYKGVPSPPPDFRDADVFSIVSEVIMSIGDTYDQAAFHFTHDVYSPYVETGTGHHLLLKINPNNLRIDKKIVFQGESTAAEVDYQNYQQLGQNFFPTLITVFIPLQQTSIALDFENPTINPALPDDLFALSIPSHVKELPLSELRIDFLGAPAT